MSDAEVRLKRLHKSCQITLERYMSLANDTCELTSKLRGLPATRDKRLEIIVQRKKEDEAHNNYLKIRNTLLAAIEADPELVNADPIGTPAPHTGPRRARSGAYRRRSR